MSDASAEYSDVAGRARLSRGTSQEAIYLMVERALAAQSARGGTLIDVGCGSGRLWPILKPRFQRYCGVDAVRYDGFPNDGEFVQANLEAYRTPLEDQSGDVVVAVETVEHLENPRAFARELIRLAKPGGWVVVTTPNQLSLLAKLTLALKNQFNAFQASSYPAHITALLEIDLIRIALENRLSDVQVFYSERGRLPLSARHWPGFASRLWPRACSDNVLMIARKP